MIQYNADQLRRIKYLLRRLSELKNGHTLSPQFTKGYPFYTYLNRFGEIELDKDSLNTDPIYQFLQQHSDIDKRVDLIELAWQYYLVYGTPNGCLFKNNSLFDTINNDSGLTLLHCTTRMNKIIDSGLLFPSGGCLGASLYCVPLRKDNRIHNLTSFMMEEEIPKTKGLEDSIAPGLLAIKIDSENFIHSNQESNGLDYLLMGEMQSSLYGQFKNNSDIHPQAFEEIELEAINNIAQALDFLNLCVEYRLNKVSNSYFISLFEKALDSINILGYVYFEVLVEYITLFQDDSVSLKYKELGEMYNKHCKRMIFELCPTLHSGFKLTEFKPLVSKVTYYLKDKCRKGLIFNNFLEDHFIEFFKWRVAQYIRLKVMDRRFIDYELTLDNIFQQNPSLIGHILHRSIRVSKKLKDDSHLYDKERASSIWALWNKENVLFPYNSLVPKGEVGINPNFPHLSYTVYRAEVNQHTQEIEFKEELQVKLAFELIHKSFSFLRSPQK